MKNITLNFGGFYESFHSEEIDNFIENEREYYENEYENKEKCKQFLEENNIEFWELYDYNETYKNYSRLYIESLNEWLINTFSVNLDITFKSLSSPKYYNYSTDVIIADIKPIKKLEIQRLLENEYLNEEIDLHRLFEEKLHDITTSSSGYIAFYNYNDVVNMIDKEHKEIFISTLIECIIGSFNSDVFFNESIYELVIQSIKENENYKEFFNI